MAIRSKPPGDFSPPLDLQSGHASRRGARQSDCPGEGISDRDRMAVARFAFTPDRFATPIDRLDRSLVMPSPTARHDPSSISPDDDVWPARDRRRIAALSDGGRE
jgi:hypothetical protein